MMSGKLVWVIVLAITIQLASGAKLLTIDPFTTSTSWPLVAIVYDSGVDGDWYSPYTNFPPFAMYETVASCVGGQRDYVLGYIAPVPVGSVAIVNVSPTVALAGFSFPLDWIGTAYIQWDGFDNGGTSQAFPGSRLNPGFTTSLDLTFGGQGQGLAYGAFTDHDAPFIVSLVDSTGLRNSFTYNLPGVDAEEPEYTLIVMPFSSATWSTPGFNFADVRGIEVQVHSTSSAVSLDAIIQPLYVYSYSISGTVSSGCSSSQVASGKQVDLKTTGGSLIRSTTTDGSGKYQFLAVTPGVYSVCLSSSAVLCAGGSQCTPVTVNDNSVAITNEVNLLFA